MAEVSEQVRIIIGQIGHPVCAGRIARHGARLGLGVLMVAQAVGVVEVSRGRRTCWMRWTGLLAGAARGLG